MKSKVVVAAVALAAAAVGGYWHYSPYLSMYQMQQAAERQDAEAFNEKVDYPRLRESLKGQMSAMLAEQMKNSKSKGFGSLGAALGLALVNPLIDAYVRPEMVMKAMQEGAFDLEGKKGPTAKESDKKVEWDFERSGVNKVIAYAVDAAKPQERVGFVFERSGFADWKLTEVRLPRS